MFPLSNWTELDVWQYIQLENSRCRRCTSPHLRDVFERDAMLYAVEPVRDAAPRRARVPAEVRFRTVGDMTCTGAVRSDRAHARRGDRRGRGGAGHRAWRDPRDDRFTEAAMEDRKREGYF